MRCADASRNQPNPELRDPIGNLRIIALSATAPNAEDVATWLKGKSYCFDNAHRPVPLDYYVYDFHSSSNPFAFENSLNLKLLELIRRYSDRRPTLVFNSTRKNAESAAKVIANDYVRLGLVQEIVESEQQRQASDINIRHTHTRTRSST